MNNEVIHWSTSVVPARERLSYWNEVLCETLFGFSLRCDEPRGFEGGLEAIGLDSLVISDSYGTARVALRDKRWIERAGEHVYSLLVDFDAPWTFVFQGRQVPMARGDVVVSDTRFEQEAHNPDGCRVRNIRLPVSWFESWVGDPGLIVGRRIPGNQRWGAALSRCVAQLTPASASVPPLPGRVMSDELGSLLSLVYMDLATSAATAPSQERAMATKVVDLVRQRCSEGSLTAADIAASANLDESALHRVLSTIGTTFGTQLQMARISLAREMLMAPLFDSLSTSEIGRRAGFSDSSYFVRVIRRHLGMTPKQVRLQRSQ